MSYQNKKVLIIGLGLSGRSAAQFLLQRGASLIGVDRHLENINLHPDIQRLKDAGMQFEYDSAGLDIDQIELVILSPGIPNSHPLVQKAMQLNIEIIGEIELGCRHINHPILGITGTNGKTTVTLLVNHVLNECGLPSVVKGNIGKPFTQEINEESSKKERIVLELSSYQLETMQQKVLDAALLLNITPDHLDRYKNMQHYALVKSSLGNCLKAEKPFFIEYRAWQDFREMFQNFNVQTYGYTKDCTIYSDLTAVYLRGKQLFTLPDYLHGEVSHDLENLMGAFALCTTQGVSGEQFIRAFESFKKPPHRIQFVREVQGVYYYDDSKGTNIEAVIRAVKLLKGSIILIAGGLDKGTGYQLWINAFQGKVKKILAIGQAANKIQQDLSHYISVEKLESLEQAVAAAARLANPGDYVLLSPGCASQDMFKDYAHRGEVFQQAVQSLINEGD